MTATGDCQASRASEKLVLDRRSDQIGSLAVAAEIDAAYDHDRQALDGGAHQDGGARGDFIGLCDFRDLQFMSGEIGLATVVLDRVYAGAADADATGAEAPRTAELLTMRTPMSTPQAARMSSRSAAAL